MNISMHPKSISSKEKQIMDKVKEWQLNYLTVMSQRRENLNARGDANA